MDISSIAPNITLLILDVDGVMTDGGIYFNDKGEELKRFNALDGQGIKFAQADGIKVAIITARKNPAVLHRAGNLGISHVLTNRADKYTAFLELCDELHITSNEVAYIGDDVLDLTVMTRIALPIAVANAHPEVKQRALFTTNALGGHGAIREVIDLLLKNRGSYDDIIGVYLP